MSEKSVAEKHPKSKALIRFSDCDPLGHLNNARYLDYFINAREDHLRHYFGLDIYKLSQTHGFAWVVTQNQIAYFKPANLNEEVVIESAVIGYDEYSVTAELKMWDEGHKKLKSILWTKFVSINLATKKKFPIPGDIIELIKNVIVDNIRIEKGFDHRVGEIYQLLKSGA